MAAAEAQRRHDAFVAAQAAEAERRRAAAAAEEERKEELVNFLVNIKTFAWRILNEDFKKEVNPS